MNHSNRTIGRRLLRNKGAAFGLIIIGAAIFVALAAYFIAPDPSPDANRMIVEIGGRSPGFRQQFLLVRKEKKQAPTSFWQRLLSGKEDDYHYIPVNSYAIKGDSLIVKKFVDEGVEERIAYFLPGLRAQGSNSTFLNEDAGKSDGASPDGKAGGTGEARDSKEDGHGPAGSGSMDIPIRTRVFWLGTDKYGRDILSRLLVGVRVSLAVGLVTVLISLSVGVLLGSLAGYFRGRVDEIIMWLINVIWSIPTLLLVFAITLMLGKGFWQVFIAIGLTLWVNVARIVRGQVLSVREREYVEAARALGYSHPRILFRHILPNVMGPVWVVSASNFASAIVIEAGLSFLGVGVQPPQPSWGLMIKENYNFIITHNPMLALAPGLAIMLLVLAFNLLGNGLRDALNVRV